MDMEGMLYCGSDEPVEEQGFGSKLKQAALGKKQSRLSVVKIVFPGSTEPRPALPFAYLSYPEDSEGVPKAKTVFRFLDNNDVMPLTYRYYQFVDPITWWRGMGHNSERDEYLLNLNEDVNMFEYLGLTGSLDLTSKKIVELRNDYPNVYVDVVRPLNYAFERSLSMNAQLYRRVRPLELEIKGLRNRLTLATQLVKVGNVSELRHIVEGWSETTTPRTPLQYMNQMRPENV